LDERVEAFIDSNAYGIDPKVEIETGEVILYGEALREPPMEEWGTIIGDVVHNLRSALDHLIWQLTLANGHTPPAVIPLRRKDPDYKWRRIGFPIYIFDPRRRYPSGRRIPWRREPPDSLWGVRPALRTDIQRLQPFTHGKNATKEPLAILEEFWNTDKHRHLHLTNFMFGLGHVEVDRPEFKFKVLKKHAPGPFKGRTELGRLERAGPPYTSYPQVYVESHMMFDVAFEQGPPAYGGRVRETLKRLHDTVAAILVKFDSEFT
jgi:hypothetical protein